jgi:hypothetical protein
MWSRSRAEDALAETDKLRTIIRAAAAGEPPVGGLTLEYAEELIAAIRTDRDGR